MGTETWLSEDDAISTWFPRNYQVYRRDRPTRGGGVLIAVKNSLQSEEIIIDNVSDIESCWCKVVTGSQVIWLSCFYRPPDNITSIDAFYKQAQTILPSQGCGVIIAGDFNLPDLKWHNSDWSSSCSTIKPDSLQNLMDEFSLEQIVDKPTRGENCLDLIFTSLAWAKESVSVELGFSDHLLVRAVFPLSLLYNQSNAKLRWRYDKADWEKINHDLETLYIVFSQAAAERTVEENWAVFKNDIKSVVEAHTPHCLIRERKDKPWFNTEVKRAIRKNRRLRQRARTSNSLYLWEEVRNQKGIVKALLKEKKQLYMESLDEDFAKNPKRFWSYVKQTKNQECGIQSILSEGKEVGDDEDKANLFNCYFESVFTKTAPGGPVPNVPRKCEVMMPEIEISYRGILNLINGLKDGKAAGPDGIVGRMLKGTVYKSAKYLHQIFKQSLEDGCVPEDWKTAAVVPIHKTGKKNDVKNYRPVSLTSICCKMMEHILVSKLVSHLEENNLLTQKQFGFRKGSSCELLLLDMVNNIARALDCGATVDLVALDMAKAFDTVPHDLLLLKLESFGVCDQVVRWYNSFLDNRKQRVVLNGAKSNEILVTSGVPQGSVSGPVLFLIYVNDLIEGVSSDYGLFADDSSLYRPITCPEDRLELQEDLDKVALWCDKWRMNLNTDKTKVLTISRTKRMGEPDYHIAGKSLQSVEKISILGVCINNQLKWNDHILKLCTRANSDVRFINRVLQGTSTHTKALVYNALVKSKLDYCSAVWDSSTGFLVDELEKVQRRAARMVFGEFRQGTCVTQLINSLEWQPLQVTRRERRLGLMYKIYHGETILDPSDYFGVPDYLGRHDHTKKVRRYQCDRAVWADSFFPQTIRDWNELKEETVLAPSCVSFNKELVSTRQPVQCGHV